MELKNGVILRDNHIIRQLGIGGMGKCIWRRKHSWADK